MMRSSLLHRDMVFRKDVLEVNHIEDGMSFDKVDIFVTKGVLIQVN